MGKITRTKTEEVWVCDHCGKEMNYQPLQCCMCKKDLCSNCAKYFTHEIVPRNIKPFSFGHIPWQSEQYSGKIAYYCIDHAEEMERQLIAMGFKNFTHNPVQAV